MRFKIVKKLLLGILVCTLHAYTSYAEKDAIGRGSIGVKLGVSSASFWKTWENVDEFGLQGKVQKTAFWGKPQFLAGAYIECAPHRYCGVELGIGYLRLGGILPLVKDSQAVRNAYLKIIQHTIAIPVGFCIYPLGVKENKGVWKIVVGGSVNFIPKRTWMVKAPGQNSEKKTDCPDDINTLLAVMDVVFYLGTGYEWACGLSLDVRGGIGLMNILYDSVDKDWSLSTTVHIIDTYKKLSPDKKYNNMHNHYFTLTIGYSLFKF